MLESVSHRITAAFSREPVDTVESAEAVKSLLEYSSNIHFLKFPSRPLRHTSTDQEIATGEMQKQRLRALRHRVKLAKKKKT